MPCNASERGRETHENQTRKQKRGPDGTLDPAALHHFQSFHPLSGPLTKSFVGDGSAVRIVHRFRVLARLIAERSQIRVESQNRLHFIRFV